jgi:indole-3-glycerol phosphate synthase
MLEQILESTRHRVAQARGRRSLAEMEHLARLVSPPVSLAERLRRSSRETRPGVQLIAEIKRRSPSAGELRTGLDLKALVNAYALGGAAALSILTEPAYFVGSLDDLLAARGATRRLDLVLPQLRKDFIVDAYQIAEARAYAADAVLLIAAALDDGQLAELYAAARSWGLDVLLEVHDEQDLERALLVGPAIVGINNRNLRDLSVDTRTVERLCPQMPPDVLVVAESGIRTADDVRHLKALGVAGMLVGEALVRCPAPLALVRELVEAGQ